MGVGPREILVENNNSNKKKTGCRMDFSEVVEVGQLCKMQPFFEVAKLNSRGFHKGRNSHFRFSPRQFFLRSFWFTFDPNS